METDEEIDDTSLGFLSNSELDVKLKSLRFLCVENVSIMRFCMI